MCGIFFCAQEFNANPILTTHEHLWQTLRNANSERGPDSQRSYHTVLGNDKQQHGANGLALEFFSSELRLRGTSPVVQPHEQDGTVLCWNGEIFDGIDIAPEENDGIKLFEMLHDLQNSDKIYDAFASVEGPYAFVLYNAATRKLYFARDTLGRRSLLVHKPSTANPFFLLASVSAGTNANYEFEEVSTEGIFCVDLGRLSESEDFVASFYECTTCLQRSFSSCFNYASPIRLNSKLPLNDFPQIKCLDEIPEWLVDSVDGVISHLDRSVELRVRDIPQDPSLEGTSRVAVLFSGGIDCTFLTYLADRHISPYEPIDLLNVAFENPRRHGVSEKGNFGGGETKKQQHKDNSKKPQALAETPTSYMVPDRVTGLQEVEELRRLCPKRIWNFVEVNVPYEESQAARQRVEALMAPSRTVMDLSLAIALYFASRGVGQIRPEPNSDPIPYTSPARVLLNGLGSDELLGGYGRHRSAYNTGGWAAVVKELQLEIDRIPSRNLGRDDRVISSNGKETRHPFLSLDVVSFLAGLPVQVKIDPRLEVGLGDKMLLRLAARKLGLVEASSRKKRAMQFGSRSARMDNNTKGDVLLE